VFAVQALEKAAMNEAAVHERMQEILRMLREVRVGQQAGAPGLLGTYISERRPGEETFAQTLDELQMGLKLCLVRFGGHEAGESVSTCACWMHVGGRQTTTTWRCRLPEGTRTLLGFLQRGQGFFLCGSLNPVAVFSRLSAWAFPVAGGRFLRFPSSKFNSPADSALVPDMADFRTRPPTYGVSNTMHDPLGK
jgi:hypothetical protein